MDVARVGVGPDDVVAVEPEPYPEVPGTRVLRGPRETLMIRSASGEYSKAVDNPIYLPGEM